MQKRFRVSIGPGSATEYLREKTGIKEIGDTFLQTAASRNKGPKYSIICGRRVYQDADLDAWIQEQVSKPVERKPRGRRKPAQAGAQ